jgi:hypothetical protein
MEKFIMQRSFARKAAPLFAACAVASTGFMGLIAAQSDASTTVQFDMARSAAAVKSGCLPDARAHVRVEQLGENERMTVFVSGLPPKTDFDLFVTQLPDAPFGVSWYQSDLHTGQNGHGSATVQGRFNHETFSLSQAGPANGSDPTQNLTGPAVKDTDAVFHPTSQFHVGLWFNSAQDAANAGCAANVTPFNGEQHAGTQILSTRNFPADHGPLEQIG